MKFKISQQEFTKALVAVSKSLLAKANLPILSNILISVSGKKLEILSTNLETATKVVVDCEDGVEGKSTVPGKMLLEYVSQIPEGMLSFEKLGEEVVVSAPKFNARFATQAVEDFPAIPKIEKGHSVFIAASEFANAVLRVSYCAAADEGRPVLTGVLCELSKGVFSMVATDGYRLGYVKLPYETKGDVGFKFVIPAKSLLEAAKIIAEDGGGDDFKVELVVSDNLNQVNFKVGNVEYTSRLIEGEFPNWQKLIPTNFTSKAKISREELIRIIRVASIFARDGGNIIKFKLGTNGKGGTLSISAVNNQVGSGESSVEIELSGAGGEIAFNFRYLLEMLTSISSDDVEFEMIESLNPGRLTLPGDASYFHIIMPVRLQS